MRLPRKRLSQGPTDEPVGQGLGSWPIRQRCRRQCYVRVTPAHRQACREASVVCMCSHRGYLPVLWGACGWGAPTRWHAPYALPVPGLALNNCATKPKTHTKQQSSLLCSDAYTPCGNFNFTILPCRFS